MSELKNAVGYIRVSTDGQVGEDKFGIDSQKQMIMEYCQKNTMQISNWYIDEGKSGAKEDRPEFDKLIYGDDITNPPVDAVVVAKSDRVARDINIYFYYKHELLKKNMELISTSEDFGQLGVLSKALEAFILVMAEMERENINKRTSGGRKIKALRGGYSGGRTPYGYDIQDGKLIVNSEESKLVVRIFELRDGGMTLSDVAEQINYEGFTTRKGKKFYASNIKSITDNRKTYQGYYKYGKEMNWVKGVHEPILKGE